MRMSSKSFNDGDTIPIKYTCSGQDISPHLEWNGVPKETRTYAIIADDPDAPAGTWVHWVLYNIPGNVGSLTENVPHQENVPGIGIQGVNDFRRFGYAGPCPPPGKPHRYFFRLYALDSILTLRSGIDKAGLVKAMQGHILDQCQWMGRFSR